MHILKEASFMNRHVLSITKCTTLCRQQLDAYDVKSGTFQSYIISIEKKFYNGEQEMLIDKALVFFEMLIEFTIKPIGDGSYGLKKIAISHHIDTTCRIKK